MKKIIILIFTAMFLAGCSEVSEPSLVYSYLDNAEIKDEYLVAYYEGFSSSGGDRTFNLTYVVEDDVFVSCIGDFTHAGTDTLVNECSADVLNKGQPPFGEVMKMSDVLVKVRSYDLSSSKMFKFSDRTCFYDIHSEEVHNLLVCFDDNNNIVNYAGKGGYGSVNFNWNVDAYAYNSDLESLLG